MIQFIAFLLINNTAEARELVSVKDFLSQQLANSAKMTKESFSLTEENKKELKGIVPESEDLSYTFYFGKNTDGAIATACTILSQNGKEGPMSLGVCFEPKGLVKLVIILSHEEDHGKKITEESFLKQFNGKKVSDAFVVGKDVDGISGATWSSRSVAEALRRASFGFSKFVKDKK